MKLYSNTKQSNNGKESVEKQEDSALVNVDEIVGVEQNTVEKEDDDDDDLLGEIDFAENEKTKKRKSIAISKILVIVGGTGVFAAFAYLMFGGMKGVNNAKKYVTPNQVKEQKVDPLEQAEKNRIEREGELQTELALGTQQRELSEKQKMTTKVAEKIEKPEDNNTNKEVPEKPQKKSASSKSNKPRQTSSTTTSNTSSPRRRQYRSAPPPVQKSRPVIQSPPPVQKPTPVIQPPPPVQKPSPVIQSPPPPIQKPSPVIQSPPPDPQVEMAKAMSYGNYGQMDYSDISLAPTPEPQVTAQVEETLANNEPTIAPGQMVEGILNTPIFWVEDLKLKAQPQRFAIELSQPLLDSEGEIFIPEKSLLVAKLKNTSQSGMVILEINGAVTPLREMVEISPETVTVMSSTGSPLIAESQRQRGGKQNLKLSVLAGLSKIGQLLNRADSTTRYSGFGGVSSHSKNGDANILGGILEGAFGELHRQAVQVSSEELEEILERPYIWVIPEGEVVQVFVNNSGW
ncbi:MAG: hypothetical protein F6K22_02420 [Okeania sp. SIO2F4]|uniref:TrbI/VirB10 family protein n=1 Tax=Okeania sp. SIO2F4 TaxID=2607790 RepID=UPI001429D795|nr:TrbI/VirB10 family protein [Okeania sp. SIO2F4]NES01778.1 hypothetical protein [Okeania sp. SIO2F4]